jgi:hypothetical protein
MRDKQQIEQCFSPGFYKWLKAGKHRNCKKKRILKKLFKRYSSLNFSSLFESFYGTAIMNLLPEYALIQQKIPFETRAYGSDIWCQPVILDLKGIHEDS